MPLLASKGQAGSARSELKSADYGGTIKYVDAYCGQNRPRSPPNQAQKIDFIGGNDWGPGPHHLYIVRSIYCALLTPYGAEFARIRRHFCCQPNLLVADRFGG